jgi:2-dehydro-3-deoxyphosphogluconate aldolase/(4S)-4-hydroxy-2-oxoglutarate aldolase
LEAHRGVTRAESAIRTQRLVAVLRGDFTWDELERVAETMLSRGFSVLEYTLAGRDALATIGRLRERFGEELVLGAGTVVTADDYRGARAAGAEFMVAPCFSAELSAAAHGGDRLFVPGVFSPSEVAAARGEGWRLLKLFPAGTGGPQHLRALRGPFPDVSFVPTGGVDADNAAEFLRAGAVAVGLGSALVRPGTPAEELDRRLVGLRALLQAETTA